MTEEEKKAIKSIKEFAYTIHGTLTVEEAKIILKLIEKKDIDIIETKEANRQLNIELKNKDKIIDEIQEEVRDHIGFENRLKRDNIQPDLFNQGRFYVANNINNILKRK